MDNNFSAWFSACVRLGYISRDDYGNIMRSQRPECSKIFATALRRMDRPDLTYSCHGR